VKNEEWIIPPGEVTEDNMIVLVLPWPPSKNSYRRHVPTNNHPLISAEGRAYRKVVCEYVRQRRFEGTLPKQPIKGWLTMNLRVYPFDRRSVDGGNYLEALQDALAYAGLYLNDKQICLNEISRHDSVKGGLVEVILIEHGLPNHQPELPL
jgi:Holliday junction resolvase RusA-like endonuclease